MKRMKHNKHGFMHAITEDEERELRMAGWVEDVPDTKESKNVIVTSKKRWGRK